MQVLDRLATRLVGGRFFFGWAIVGVSFASAMLFGGIELYGLAFFVIPMSEALGVSRGAFSSVALLPLVFIPLFPYAGSLVDRKNGPRLMLSVGTVGAGLVIMANGAVQTLWQFLVLFGLVYGLVVTFMDGAGALHPALMAKWFVRRRGRAMAIGTMGISAGGVFIAPLVGWLIDAWGWRPTWVVMGALVIVVVAPAAAVFIRRAPEDLGLRPDGDPPRAPTGGTPGVGPVDSEYPWTVREAVRTPAFWVLLGVGTLGFAGIPPVITHQVAFVQDKGFPLSVATALATLFALAAFVAKLPWGLLAERFAVRWLVPFCLVPAGLVILVFTWTDRLPLLFACAAVAGYSIGGFPTLSNMVWAEYFGRRHQGAIRGVVNPAMFAVPMGATVFAGWMWDVTGSYHVPFSIFAVVLAAAGMLMLLAIPPRVPETQPGAGR